MNRTPVARTSTHALLRAPCRFVGRPADWSSWSNIQAVRLKVHPQKGERVRVRPGEPLIALEGGEPRRRVHPAEPGEKLRNWLIMTSGRNFTGLPEVFRGIVGRPEQPDTFVDQIPVREDTSGDEDEALQQFRLRAPAIADAQEGLRGRSAPTPASSPSEDHAPLRRVQRVDGGPDFAARVGQHDSSGSSVSSRRPALDAPPKQVVAERLALLRGRERPAAGLLIDVGEKVGQRIEADQGVKRQCTEPAIDFHPGRRIHQARERKRTVWAILRSLFLCGSPDSRTPEAQRQQRR